MTWAAAARAGDSPYQLHAPIDATALGVSTLLWVGPWLLRSKMVDTVGCPCAAAELNPIDRGTAGVYRPALSLASDIASGSLLALVLLLDALDVHAADEPVVSLLSDVVVLAEVVVLNGALNELAKIAFSRPRPLLYGRSAQDPLLGDPENYVSFYSGHTSSAFAAGLAYAQTYAYRHPKSGWRYAMFAGALAAGSGMGLARIASGKHFTTDVLAGAATGTLIGLVVPFLHARGSTAQLSVQIAPDRALIAVALPEL